MAADAQPNDSTLSDRAFFALNAGVSVIALAVLGYLLLAVRSKPVGWDVAFLPTVNAACNATAALCLVFGYRAIRRGDRARHQQLMLGAFIVSIVFLIGYLVYHYAHGETRYVGPLRPLYLGILASHILLSMPVVPLVLTTLFFASRGRFAVHRKVAKWTFPIWLYVSVTGVVVYLLLKYAAAS